MSGCLPRVVFRQCATLACPTARPRPAASGLIMPPVQVYSKQTHELRGVIRAQLLLPRRDGTETV